MPVLAFVLISLLSLATSAAAADDFEGKACDDHDPCTTDDRFAGGMCRGEPRSCDDGLPCTVDFCDRASGRCGSGLRIDQCLIDGACFRDGDSNPASRCQVCRPARSANRWTETTVCDDGNPCTLDDRCVEGRCEGTAYACAGAGECTTSRCDGRGGCIEEPLPGHCRVQGLCVRDGHSHPIDACRRCDAAISTSEWADATGAACPGGTCIDGACLATVVIEVKGAGTGRVLGPGFECTTACVQQVVPESPLDLTVVAGNGSVFTGWKGACAGLAPCRLSAYGHVTVSAIFERDTVPPP